MIRVTVSLVLGVIATFIVAWVLAAKPAPALGFQPEQSPGRWGRYFTGVYSQARFPRCADVDLYPGRVTIEWTTCPMCGMGLEWFKSFEEGEFAQVSSWTTFLQSDGAGDGSVSCIERAAGWPLLALRSSEVYRGWPATLPETVGQFTLPLALHPGTSGKTVVPIRPIWSGLILNALLYAAMPWLAMTGLSALRRAMRGSRGCCARCGYDLRGAAHDRCPECGAMVERHEVLAARSD